MLLRRDPQAKNPNFLGLLPAVMEPNLAVLYIILEGKSSAEG